MTTRYAVIDQDGTSYLVDADGPGAAVEIAGAREDGCDVEDFCGVALPATLQGDTTGEAQEWLTAHAQRRGLAVIQTSREYGHRVVS